MKPRRGALAVLIILLSAGVFTYSSSGSALAAPPLREDINVALDAGHGGADLGASGPTGLIEKDVTLELVRKMALLLESEIRVTLTRSDDYQLPLRQRAAIANQSKADLLISLHTGASFLHSSRGLTIYYHRPAQTPDNAEDASVEKGIDLQRWSLIQTRHTSASMRLAKSIQSTLANMVPATDCKILSAPLPLLEGADMPAVLIEVGSITNPASESTMRSQQGLDLLARALHTGIVDYLNQ